MAKKNQRPERVPSFDEQMPRWKQVDGVVAKKDGLVKMYLDTEARRKGARTFNVLDRFGKKQKFVMPAIRYERAIDPSGNLMAMPIGSTHTGEDDPAMMATKIAEKEAAGWLFIDRPPRYADTRDPEAALERWQRECMTVREDRIAEHNAVMEEAARYHASKEETFYQKVAEQNAEVVRSAMDEFRKGMAETLKAAKGG